MNDQTQHTSTMPTGAASRAEGANLTAVLEAGGTGWTRSLVEEVIGCLWLIAAVLAFGFKFDTLGWLLAIKAAMDQGCAIWFSVKEAIAKKKASNAIGQRDSGGIIAGGSAGTTGCASKVAE